MNEVEVLTLPHPPKSGIKEYNALNVRDRWIVDYACFSGLFIDDTGLPAIKTHSDFAHSLGYASRQSVYDRQNSIKDYWQIVDRRRFEIDGPIKAAVARGNAMAAMAGKSENVKLWKQEHEGWRPPSQDHVIEAGNSITGALLLARQRQKEVQDNADSESARAIAANTDS